MRELFGADAIATAGRGCWAMIRDPSCRLFGYHQVRTEDGRFSLDHLFGF
jgi:hypothetical protein